MLGIGKKKLERFKNVEWFCSSAEKLPFKDETFDTYVVSFGIRNFSNIKIALKESKRVLKTGGRFLCLEFSKVNNEVLSTIYERYSKLIPHLGKYIVGKSEPYDYLIKSIDDFYTQNELVSLMENNGFSNIDAIDGFIGSETYKEVSSGKFHDNWFEELKKKNEKIPEETMRLLKIQREMMIKQLIQYPELYYTKSHFPLEISQRAFDHLWRMCESYELWCKETGQKNLIQLELI